MESGVLQLFNNDVKWMIRWAFNINAMVIVKGSEALVSMMQEESKPNSQLNFTPQEAHAQAAMILRRLKMLSQPDMCIIYGLYDRRNRQVASTALADYFYKIEDMPMKIGILKEMIMGYMGDKALSVRNYAVLMDCSTGHAHNLRAKVFDLCAKLDEGAHIRAASLFQVVEEVAA